MERWDLYTADRKKTGKTIYRGQAAPEGLYRMVVGIWTVNSKGEILLTLRHPQKDVYPNTWENSGGAAQMGESSRQAAARELREETGIEASEEELLYLGTYTRKGVISGAFIDSYLVHRDVAIDDLTLQDGETVDAKWVTPAQLDALCKEGVVAKPVADRWEELKNKIMS